MKEAMDIYLFSNLDNGIKVDSSLALTNRALQLDDQNIQALSHKFTLLFRKRDSDGLLQIVDDLIMLQPKRPIHLAQKALCLELKGDSSKANEYYVRALGGYEEYLKNDSRDFNLMMEYVEILEISGDTTLASKTLIKMNNMDFDSSEKEMFDLYKRNRTVLVKKKLLKYWNGEIDYDKIEEK